MKPFLSVVVVLMVSCSSGQEAILSNCDYEKTMVKTTNQGTFSLPRVGLLVEESHYLSKEDVHIESYPSTITSGIEEHLARSCAFLKVPCSAIYRQSWEKVWTPSEGGGNIGGNARAIRPTMIQELFQGNMMFAKGYLPKPGEKWLVRNHFTGKAVVVSMGYEIGPGSRKFLGGISIESHYFLGSNNETELEFGKLKDQEMQYGPANCK